MRSVRSLVAVLAALLAVGALAVGSVRAQEGDTLEVDLQEIDGSGVSGTAILTDEGDAVTVEIEVTGDAVVGGHPVHIHEGTCENLDPAPAYPLADIDEDGLSETTIDGVTLADLTAADFAINAHLSAEEVGTYIACGNLTAAGAEAAAAGAETEDEEVTEEAAAPAETPAAGTGGTTTTAIPASGVGSTVGDAGNGLLVALLALAGVLAAAGIALRLRETRA